jgi:hypothetical protein
MDDVNYPSNSKKPKAEEPKKARLKPIIMEGEAFEKKKSLGRRIADNFTGDDAHTVGQYIMFDILLPAAKAMIVDAISQGAERFLLGGTSRSRSSAIGRTMGGYTQYSNRITSIPKAIGSDPRTRAVVDEEKFDINQIIVTERGQAELILDSMRAQIENYEFASVTDLKDLLNMTSEFTDEKWGWSDLTGARTRAIGGGYLLVMPRVESRN